MINEYLLLHGDYEKLIYLFENMVHRCNFLRQPIESISSFVKENYADFTEMRRVSRNRKRQFRSRVWGTDFN